MSNKNINDIIIFMINNNLDYKNYDLLSNLNVFINKDYISHKKLITLVRSFENNLVYSNLNSTGSLNSASSILEALEMLRNRFESLPNNQEEENDEYFEEEHYDDEEEEETNRVSFI